MNTVGKPTIVEMLADCAERRQYFDAHLEAVTDYRCCVGRSIFGIIAFVTQDETWRFPHTDVKASSKLMEEYLDLQETKKKLQEALTSKMK
jgi:predicted metal-binding protein